MGATPGGGALDDEEAFPSLYVAEPASLAGELFGRVGILEPLSETVFLRAEQAHLLGALSEGIPAREVTTKGLRVEERDEDDDSEPQPAEKDPPGEAAS